MAHRPLDKIFSAQSYDPESRVFLCQEKSGKSIGLSAMWIGEPINGLDESSLLSLQTMLATPFPKDSVLQFGLLASPDIDQAIESYRRPKMNSAPLLRELANRHAELIASGASSPLVGSSGVLLTKRRLVVSLKLVFPAMSARNLSVFVENANKLDSSIRANRIAVKRADAQEYLALIRLITHLHDPLDDRYDEEKSLSEQAFYVGDEVVINKNHIQFNTGSRPDRNFVMGALSPKHFPPEFALPMMNNIIGDPVGVSNQIVCPYFMTLTLFYPEQVSKRSVIETKQTWLDRMLIGSKSGGVLRKLHARKEGLNILQNETQVSGMPMVEAIFTFWLYANNERKLREELENVRVYWSSKKFDMRADSIILDALLDQSLPFEASVLGAAKLERTHTLAASQATQFLPIIAEWRGSGRPVVMLTTRRGEVGGFDLYASSSNYNALLVAQSGAGKSFWTQRLTTDYLAEGAKVWVIDQGRSYQKLAAAVKGSFIEFSPSSDICMNPFTAFLPERGGANKKIDDDMEALSSLLEKMISQRNPLGDLEIETVRKAIRQTFMEHQGHSTVRHVADWLAAQHHDPIALELAKRMDTFAYGQYSRYFNDHANVDMSADFVVLELDDLKSQKQLQQVVLLQIMAQITNEMYLTGGRKKILIIDEGWALLDDPVMGQAMITAFRTARKHGGAIVLITQGIGDLYASPNGKSMVENAAWQLVLAQKSEAIDAVYKNGQLNLDPYFYKMLKTVQMVPGAYSEVMITGNGGTGIYRLIVDKFTTALFSTSGKERSQVMADLAAGVDIIESLQRLVAGDDAYQRLKSLRVEIEAVIRAGTSKQEIHRMIVDALEAVDRQVLASRNVF